jgi:hypothetical protein
MAATRETILGQLQTPQGGPATVAGAFPQVTPNATGPQNLDLIQIVDEGGLVLVNVDYQGTVGKNPVSPTNGVRVRQVRTLLAATATTAQIFADAFYPNANQDQSDILQVVNPGGNIHYYLDYTGTAHGS